MIGLIYSIAKIQPAAVGLYGIEKSLQTKTVELADLQIKLETLKAAEAEKNLATAGLVKKVYKPETEGLDAESSFTVIFDDIIEMAKYNGIKIYSIEYIYNPPEDEFVKGAADKFNVCEVNLDIISDYVDLESFLKELYKYPYLVNINKFTAIPYTKNKKILLTKLQLKLYSSK